MKALSKRLLRLTLFAIATTSLFSVRPVQAYTVRLHQVGSNVVATGSGPINLTGLTFTGLSSSAAGMNPSIADLAVATGLQDQYQGFSGPLSFGPGGITFANSNSGDAVTLISGMTSFSGLFVPQGYVSGGALSSSSTYNNATFASLGVTPGTYVWSWGQGANQRFTLIIGGVGVPDAGSTLPLLGFGLLGLAALQRKLSY
jgi:VPDSG-CTERM motif